MKPFKETVLLYNFNDREILKKLKGIFIQLNIRIKIADHSMLHESVGYLIGIKEFEPAKEAGESIALTNELIVMRGFTSQRLDQLLLQIRKAGIPSIGLKAVITEQNKGWTLEHLYKEIEKEHIEMSKKDTAI